MSLKASESVYHTFIRSVTRFNLVVFDTHTRFFHTCICLSARPLFTIFSMVKYWLSSALALSSFISSAWGVSTDQCQPTIQTEVSILKFIDRPAEDTRSVYIEGYYAYNTTIRVDAVNSLQVTCAPCSVNSWVTFAASTVTPTTYT